MGSENSASGLQCSVSQLGGGNSVPVGGWAWGTLDGWKSRVLIKHFVGLPTAPPIPLPHTFVCLIFCSCSSYFAHFCSTGLRCAILNSKSEPPAYADLRLSAAQTETSSPGAGMAAPTLLPPFPEHPILWSLAVSHELVLHAIIVMLFRKLRCLFCKKK